MAMGQKESVLVLADGSSRDFLYFKELYGWLLGRDVR